MMSAPVTTILAQAPETGESLPMPDRRGMPARPSTYEQVDTVRNLLGLSSRQFDKVYSAYDKYNKAIFGDPDQQRRGPMGGGMGPGRGMGPGHGMGPGRGMGPGPGNFGGGDFRGQGPRGPRAVDLEKLEKKKLKQEEKLCKTMQKIFKDSTHHYDRWLEIRETQLSEMFPHRNDPVTQQPQN